eukprot:3324647-Amphidinium_carterae.2
METQARHGRHYYRIRRRGVRARLTVRGFKDMSPTTDVFSATASRLAQRIVASESVLHPDWQLAGIDIRKAFLQGVTLTYEELSKETSTELKEVNFKVPPGTDRTVGILRTITGYADFDPKLEVLGLLKPGTGLRDAPRAFQVKLRQSTAHFGWLAAPENVRDQFIKHLQQTFGPPDMEVSTFCNCVVNHTSDPKTGTRRLDQFKFMNSCIQDCHASGYSTVRDGIAACL